MPEFQTILPSNATPLQRALERIAADRLAAIALPLADIWDADKCPINLLGYLAWSLSVDYWDEAWPEAQKRAVVAASYDVHRMKGTIGAVRAALGALNFGIEIREWFETGGPSGTFSVDAFADDVFAAGFGITPQLVSTITRQIDTVKRGSQHYSLRVGERFKGRQPIRVGIRQKTRHSETLRPLPEPDYDRAAIFIRPGLRQKAIDRETLTFSASTL